MLGQLDLAHAARANGLAEGPCSGAGSGDGGSPLGGGLRDARHCGGGASIRRVAIVAPPLVGAAADEVVGEVALLVVVGFDVVQAGLRAALGMGLGAVRAV